jgi:thiol-disulfide isomerase/thioredoxin
MLWTSKFVRSLAIVVVSPSIWLVALTESWATERSVPAYRFAVGQELAYGEENLSLGMPGDPPDQPRNKTSGEWQIWVVGKNSDGSWRLLLRHKYLVVSIKPKQQPVERLSNCMLAHCDIFPDGRVPKNSTLGDSYYFQINPNWLFVALPRDQKAMTTGWSQVPVIGEWSRRCSIDSARTGSARSLVINCIEHDPSQAAYGETKTRRCTFDLDAGRLSEMVEDDTASAGKFPWHARTTLKLKSASQKPADWVTQLDREATEFFAARTKYEHLSKDFNRTRAADAHIAQSNRAREFLTAARTSAKLAILQEQYQALIKEHDRVAKLNLRSAQAREDVYSRPAANWELKTIDGSKHRLADDRGKVVILDFWYRGCYWCTKALPQIEQVADRYKGKPVVVLGMNIDPEEGDARFVIRQMGLKYPQLKAEPAASAYRANDLGYPVLYILDQNGRVHDIQEGYRADLGKRIEDVVDRLLGETAH